MEDIEELITDLREVFAPMVRELCADDKFDCDELCAGNIMTSECIIFRAASALEHLCAENERLRSTCYPKDGVEAIIRERDAYKEELAAERAKYAELQRYNVDCTKACDRQMVEILELREQNAELAESQRRERAATEDLNGTGACFTCKHFRRNGGDCFGAGRCRLDGIEIWPCNEPGVYRVEVPDDGRKTYEWRGPQEAGEGETE